MYITYSNVKKPLTAYQTSYNMIVKNFPTSHTIPVSLTFPRSIFTPLRFPSDLDTAFLQTHLTSYWIVTCHPSKAREITHYAGGPRDLFYKSAQMYIRVVSWKVLQLSLRTPLGVWKITLYGEGIRGMFCDSRESDIRRIVSERLLQGDWSTILQIRSHVKLREINT